MPKPLKKILLIHFILYLVIIFSLGSYFLAENLFFDKFFYDKSVQHGYWNLTKGKDYTSFDERVDDLLNLRKEIIKKDNDDPSLLEKKDKDDVFTIVIIGDSYVWGQGLRYHQRFPVILEKKLNKYQKTEVVSLGNCGNSILENLLLYKTYTSIHQPNFVIFGLVDNDLAYDGLEQDGSIIGYTPQDTEENLKELLVGCNQDHIIDTEHLTSDLEKEDYFKFLDSLLENEDGNLCIFKNIVAKLPKQDTIYFDYGQAFNFHQPTHAVYQDYLKTNGFRVITQQFDNATDYKKLSVSAKDHHPSSYANQLFAQTLFEFITAQESWKNFK